ncbi:Na(+)/H(+) antiporter subunit D [Tepidimonas sediminis]|uniref:Na(+)/H(+) antiporter subunit D n=1 Tax=Tepidimonas sediminis TaxID=2588941 RepID=A0A554WJZ7_9BURK|nr:proton-conducting transporter membrane subunit [Tepidimonas sediminis]TSE23866.1 Na(+)/H(+) antiporter subunit D [Tepidimonas sediminis]
MSWLVTVPVLVPLATAAATTLLQRHAAAQRVVSHLGAWALLAGALALVAQAAAGVPLRMVFGDWGEPFGIVFAVDRLSAALVLVTAVMAVACLTFQASDADPGPAHPLQLPLVHGLLAGVGGAFATADLFNLYVWFEVMLICAVGLLALGGRTDQLDGTFKYYTLNLVGTLLLLLAVGMVYAVSGHLNYGALAQALPQVPAGPAALALAGLLLAFLVKAGAFPLFAWLPAAYPTLPAPLLALFAGLLTKVGAYAVLRTLADLAPAAATAWLAEALGWIAAATMLVGVLGAAYHWDMRRILAFHIVSQIGYILLAVALASPAGDAAALFYTLHHIVVKANLFLIAAIVWRLTGGYDLRAIGGLWRARPWLGVLFLVPALSLVGIPPLSGFWSKLWVLQEALAQGRLVWTAVALLVSVLTLYSMMKIWMEAFWKPHPQPGWQPPRDARLGPAWAATLVLALITLAIGLWPQGLLDYALAAAGTLGGGAR